MKDALLYVFLFALYGILALHLFAAELRLSMDIVTWPALGRVVLLFAGVATVARWTVMAFKPRADRLLAGQKIVGIEEQEGENVIDVLRPQPLKRETKKPKLKRRRFL